MKKDIRYDAYTKKCGKCGKIDNLISPKPTCGCKRGEIND